MSDLTPDEARPLDLADLRRKAEAAKTGNVVASIEYVDAPEDPAVFLSLLDVLAAKDREIERLKEILGNPASSLAASSAPSCVVDELSRQSVMEISRGIADDILAERRLSPAQKARGRH